MQIALEEFCNDMQHKRAINRSGSLYILDMVAAKSGVAASADAGLTEPAATRRRAKSGAENTCDDDDQDRVVSISSPIHNA
jgi:hypothetical protein